MEIERQLIMKETMRRQRQHIMKETKNQMMDGTKEQTTENKQRNIHVQPKTVENIRKQTLEQTQPDCSAQTIRVVKSAKALKRQ